MDSGSVALLALVAFLLGLLWGDTAKDDPIIEEIALCRFHLLAVAKLTYLHRVRLWVVHCDPDMRRFLAVCSVMLCILHWNALPVWTLPRSEGVTPEGAHVFRFVVLCTLQVCVGVAVTATIWFRESCRWRFHPRHSDVAPILVWIIQQMSDVVNSSPHTISRMIIFCMVLKLFDAPACIPK
jgi:hypothetical protein